MNITKFFTNQAMVSISSLIHKFVTLNHRKSGIGPNSGTSLQMKTKQIFDLIKKRLQKNSEETFISNRAAYSNHH